MEYRLIVFLGNPGHQYARTRHNVGWMVADRLGVGGSGQKKFKGVFAKEGQTALLKPETYMNRSGESVQACAAFFSLRAEDILVVHDETELFPGELQLKAGGGTAGHNGLKSLRERLGNDRFHRLRIGVGRPDRGSLSSYVLSAPTPDEMATLEPVIDASARLIEDILHRRDSSLAPRLAGGRRITPAEPG
ncbi:MAG: aminoacyl-tRNA hydrolase [Alkalispirochaetaceae bacterium]